MTENIPVVIEHQIATLDAYAANLQVKLQVCKMLRESGFCPVAFKTDAAVFAAVTYGQEIGFSPMQAIQSIDVIQGKPTLSAQGMKALVQSKGGKIRDLEWTDKICTLEGDRDGFKQTATFTIQEAATMGLTNKDNWKRMPKLMLYARAVSILCRNLWADYLKGFYSTEEMRDSVNAPVLNVVPSMPALGVVPADELPPPQEEEAPGVRVEYTLDPKSKDFSRLKAILKENRFMYNAATKAWTGFKRIAELEKGAEMGLSQEFVDDDVPPDFYLTPE